MRINLYSLVLFTILFTTVGYADNPGEDESVAPEVVETSTDTATEEVVTAEAEVVQATTSDADDEVVTLEKVIVTGSRIKRTQQEGALPILVITKEDMDNSGFKSVTEALQSIPSANEYTQGESFTNSFTPNANELDLRNLGPGRILFLINGRRTADYPIPFNNAGNIVNTGIVPSGLVDRIEVLSQGASAIYGSDAVSGVVNIITLQGKDFSEFEIYSSQMEAGGDNIHQATFTTGGFFGNSSWTLGINAEVRDPMYYADRDGFNSFVNDPGYGTSYVAPRSGLVWYTQAAAGGLNRYYGSEEFGIPCSSISPDYFDFDKQVAEYNYRGSYPGHYCGHDYGSERFGGTSATMSNEREDASAMLSFTHNFDNGMTLDSRIYTYTDKAYYRSEVNRYLFMSGGILDPRRVGEFVATSTDPSNQVPFGTVGYHEVPYFLRYFSANNAPNAEARTDVEEQLVDAFVGLSGTTSQGYEWSVGLNSTVYDYETDEQTFTDKMYDYFAGVGATDADGNLLRSSYREYQYGYAYDQAFLNQFGIEDPVCGWQNYFGRSSCFLSDRLFGEVTNDMLGSWLADDSMTAKSEQTTIDFQLSGEFELGNRFVGFAVSADHQEQEYLLTPSAGRLDDDAEAGAIVFIQGSAIGGGGERTRDSIGVEFSTQVTSKLEANFATRYDKYDDDSSNVGSRQSTMFSMAYRPNDDLLIRGSISESFRAPDMNYLFQKASSGFYNGFQDYVACYAYNQAQNLGYRDYRDCEVGQGSVQALLSGNTALEEEEGENFQLGLVWDITNNLNFSLDLFEVMLERAVSRESPYTINYAEGKCAYGDAFETFMNQEFPVRDCAAVAAQITRGPAVNDLTGAVLPIGAFTQVRPNYSNQSYLNYEGADWSMNYRLETENAGDFFFGLSSSHILKSASKFDDLSEETDALDEYNYEPRSQQNISISWRYKDISSTLFTDRTGHMEAYKGYSTPGKTDPHFIMNLSTSYNYSPDLNFYLSIRNLENKMPQRDEAYGFPYYNRGYFNAYGRYITLGGSYRF
jgi:outer membrane receptor protein involved in Fe transport